MKLMFVSDAVLDMQFGDGEMNEWQDGWMDIENT